VSAEYADVLGLLHQIEFWIKVVRLDRAKLGEEPRWFFKSWGTQLINYNSLFSSLGHNVAETFIRGDNNFICDRNAEGTFSGAVLSEFSV
jgi:hypothetical protein